MQVMVVGSETNHMRELLERATEFTTASHTGKAAGTISTGELESMIYLDVSMYLEPNGRVITTRKPRKPNKRRTRVPGVRR